MLVCPTTPSALITRLTDGRAACSTRVVTQGASRSAVTSSALTARAP